MEQKTCNTCALSQNTDQFGVDKTTKDGLSRYCRSCVRINRKRSYAANQERERERSAAYKAENPEATKTARKAWSEANPGRDAENAKAWRQKNPERAKETTKRWQADNKDHIREARRAKYKATHPKKVKEPRVCPPPSQTPEYKKKKNAEYYRKNPERERARAAAYRVANPEKTKATAKAYSDTHKEEKATLFKDWYEADPERNKVRRKVSYDANKDTELAVARIYKERFKDELAQKAAAYLRENPEYNRYARSMRRAVEKMAIPKWADKKAIRKIYAQAAAITIETGKPHHVDHIVPLISKWVCGLHCEANLQVLTGPENQSKSNRRWPDMPEFLLKRTT